MKRYWWVNQRGHFFFEETKLGCIWAPKKNARGRTPFHWQTLTKVRPNDIIFSYHKKKIAAVGIAISKAYNADRPDSFPSKKYLSQRRKRTGEGWNMKGRKVNVNYKFLDNHVDIKKIFEKIKNHLNYKHSPYSVNFKRGNLGYLFYLNPLAAEIIRQEIDSKDSITVDQKISDADSEINISSGKTDAIRKQKMRLKQGEFRINVLNLWNNKCCVTDLKEKNPSLLVAAHIWPYMHCENNKQKIDRYNGLPLVPGYDKAFDKGYISFSDNGEIMKSNKIEVQELIKLGIDLDKKISGLSSKHKFYLKKHRKLHGFN